MSIAVSATVVRSRLLATTCVAMAGVLSGAAMLLWPMSPALVAVCAIAAAALALFPLSTAKTCRIDVTDIGQILLVENSHEAGAGSVETTVANAEVVQLLGGSTFWSSLMVLRLQSASGRIHRLVLLPDSMDRETFRALSVACRWIASRGTQTIS